MDLEKTVVVGVNAFRDVEDAVERELAKTEKKAEEQFNARFVTKGKDFISQFLPKQINESDTEKLILEIIRDHNFKTIKDMGKLMNNLKSDYASSVDMALAGKIAKSKLSN
jgi:uncharacterized protein YqeY